MLHSRSDPRKSGAVSVFRAAAFVKTAKQQKCGVLALKKMPLHEHACRESGLCFRSP